MPEHLESLDEEKDIKRVEGYNPVGDELNDFKFLNKRINELKNSRKNSGVNNGYDVESIWKRADRDCRLDEIGGRGDGKKVTVDDETLGWRGTVSMTTLGKDDWQNVDRNTNPFVKVQSALAILVDKIPEHELVAANERYEAKTEIMKALLSRNWSDAGSKHELKLFMYNLGKFGFSVARTHYRIVERSVRDLIEIKGDGKKVYDSRVITDYDDVYRETLDPWNVWIDDMARPYDRWSCRDWCWRKIISKDEFDGVYGEFENSKYVVGKGGLGEREENVDSGQPTKEYSGDDNVELFFYENRPKDRFMVMANGVMVVNEPLPYDHKQLSCWYAFWNLRNGNTAYGVGLPELMRPNKKLLEKIVNMTMDQLVLSIYKMFFYTGTDALDGSGKIKIQPGIGKQVMDTKVTWLDVPGPGAEAWKGIQYLQGKVDEDTAISKTLEGEITGKTAFEVAQATESGLKRLKTPLGNLEWALQIDGELSIALIQQFYPVAKVERIVAPEQIEAYKAEVGNDSAFYFYDVDGSFWTKRFRTYRLAGEKNENEEFVPGEDDNFFRILPGGLDWRGQIKIKPMSTLSTIKELHKAQKLEMANLIVPLFSQPAEIAMKPVKQILKIYNESPKDWLPDSWINPQKPELFVNANQSLGGMPGGERPIPGKKTMMQGAEQPARVVPTTKTGGIKSAIAGMISKINPFSSNR